jgi:hypothetical protein
MARDAISHALRISENEILRKIIEFLRKNHATRKLGLLNEELHYLYF